MRDQPAFPSMQPLDSWGDPYRGMTLREWYAGQALVGIVAGLTSNPATDEGEPCYPRAIGRLVFASAADDAFALADAMMARRAAETARAA